MRGPLIWTSFFFLLSLFRADAQSYTAVFDSFLVESKNIPVDKLRRHFFKLKIELEEWPASEKIPFLEKWVESEAANQYSPNINFEVTGMLYLMYNNVQKYDHSLQLAKRRLAISKNIEDPRYYLTAVLNHADLFTKREEYDSAYHYVNRALEEAKRYDLYHDRSGILIALATIHRQTGQLDKSKEVLEEALSLTKDNHRNKGYLLYLLVELSYEMDSVAAYVEYGNQLLEETKFEPHLAIQEHNLLEEIILTEDSDAAVEKLLTTIDFMKNQGGNVSGLYQYSIMALASKCKNRSDSLSILLPRVRVLVERLESQQDQWRVAPFYRLLSKLSEKEGDDEEALKYYKKYNDATFSKLRLDQQDQLAELEVKYDAESKKRKILEQEIQLETAASRRNIMLTVFGLLLFLGLVALYSYRRRLNLMKVIKEKEIQEVKQSENLKMANAVIDTQEQERSRIARELHDDLGGVMSSIRMKIEELGSKGMMQEQEPGQLSERMAYACDRLRAISHEMIPLSFSVVGLEASVSDLVADVQSQGLDVDYEWVGEVDGMPKERAINIYRILQELFHNTIKHADADQVLLQIFIKDDIQILFEDDGKGFDVTSTSDGIGMKNIHSRVSYLQGELLVDSVIGQGTTTTINIPLSHE